MSKTESKLDPKLKGNIYQRGKRSWRVQLSLGKTAQGRPLIKRETVNGTKQQAIELLTRWNVELLDNDIYVSNFQTIEQAYKEWIKFVEQYREPNTARFYQERFAVDILPLVGHKRLKDVSLSELQQVLFAAGSKDEHVKRALSALYGWCVTNKKIKRNPCRDLQTIAKPKTQTEEDAWNFEQVKKVYKSLKWKNLYDIFIVLGIECGMRPGEILALTWDKVDDDHILVDRAIKDRTTQDYQVGTTKTREPRIVLVTPFLKGRLEHHKAMQKSHIAKTKGYAKNNFVVADKKGSVPDRKYIRRYVMRVARKAGVPEIPPKNLRTTHISLLIDLGVPLSKIQEHAGHKLKSDVTSKHYIRIFREGLSDAIQQLQNRLHD